ncbi:FkbM family methyltransferase [Acidiferrimicrobium sp. IK]|uniref:FkbM family methyltransferase n=1 Tax=Acidiferrimicrobium sp. IK TaxID=2871700 RepID=UPI0021CB6199|nr:FkbM family methyltransferase [Acidiferrimicrobium sp. IK]MCU4186113.1 FkbM family methyltransferase [Acidiferrimicrobium sp. IK]
MPALLVELVHRCGGAFLDVGANTGVYAVLALAARSKGRVVAFEPVPAIVELLRANLRINQPRARRVEVLERAITDVDGTVQLYLPPPSGTTIETSASLDPTFKEVTDVVLDVTAQRLDTWWAGAGRPEVDLVKIDTEGTEHRVFAGASRLIQEQRPIVVYELLPRADPTGAERLVAGAGYVDVRLRPETLVAGGPVEFDPDGWNHALVPREKLPIVRAAADRLGLGFVTADT